MPIDARIILNQQPTTRPNPQLTLGEILQSAQQLRAGTQLEESNKLKLEQQRVEQQDSMQNREAIRQSAGTDEAGAPTLRLSEIGGRMGAMGLPGAVKVQQDYEDTIANRKAAYLTTTDKTRDQVKALVDGVYDEESRKQIEQQADEAGLTPYMPIAVHKSYDPVVWKQIKVGLAGIAEQRQQESAAQSKQHADTMEALTVRGQDLTADRALTANQIQMQHNDSLIIESMDRQWENEVATLRQLQLGVNKVRSFAELLDPKTGKYKSKTADERALDKGIADGFGMYGFANIKDARGAVMTSDIENQLAGRGLKDAAITGFNKAFYGAGILDAKERLAVIYMAEKYYEKQKASVEVARQNIKNKTAKLMTYIPPDQAAGMVATSGYLAGEQPATEGTTARSGAPAPTMAKPSAPSAPAPAKSPAATTVTRPVEGGPAVKAPNGKWYKMINGVVGEVPAP